MSGRCKGIEGDTKRWLEETAAGTPVRLGLVEGNAMLRGDWRAVQRAAGGAAIELDTHIDALRASISVEDRALATRAAEFVELARAALARLAKPGGDLRAAIIEMERAVYAAGAQDVRVRVGRRPGGAPTTLPNGPLVFGRADTRRAGRATSAVRGPTVNSI